MIAALAAVSVFFCVPKKGGAAEVSVKGERVALIDLASGEIQTFSDGASVDGNRLTVMTDAGKNVIEIDTDKKTVRVVDADCVGKECMNFDLSSGAIICAPHSLIISISGEIPSPKVG